MNRTRSARAALLVVFGLLAAGTAAGCARPRVAELYPQLTEYGGRVIDEVTFVNPDPFSADSLDALTETEGTYCRWLVVFPFCFPGTDWGRHVRRLDLPTVGGDVDRLTRLYRQSGFFGTRVEPEVTEPSGDDGPIDLAFVIYRGDAVILESVVVEGTEGIADPDSVAEVLPLREGERFELADFVASADTVNAILRSRGHAYAEVLRNYGVDTLQDRANVVLVAVPGPRVVVDSIIVTGNEVLDRGTLLRQLTFEQGDLLQRRALVASQRNLYALEMTQFAAVSVAPDTVQLTPMDSTTATVLVQMTEAPEHVVETMAGYGTQDCGQLSGQWTDRSFTGGARRLSLGGSLSRIPVACGGPDEATLPFTSEWDYRATAELRQPYFLSPRNNLVATAFAERQSEPQLYQRTAQGARFAMTRRAASRELLSTALEIEHRETLAAPALYCAAFAVCTPDDILLLGQARWRNALSANWLRDAGNRVVDPTSGYTVRANTLWASPLLLSDYDFLRASIEGAVYRELRPGWVLAGYLRTGSFITRAGIGREDFVPPEERFYAGGASSVRGYARSRLGPGIWLYEGDSPDDIDPATDTLDVEFFPTGGTSVAVASVEARFPSPVLGDLTDMAVFIDAGTVGLESLWKLTSQWRVTPGAGLRIATPVGPIRVDVAYNPYPQTAAPLYVQDFETGAISRVTDDYRPADPTFLERLQFHIALGQAY